MKKIIHHLRRQPEETKRYILQISTIFIAVILLVLWIFSLTTSIGNTDNQAKISNDLQPFSALKDNIVGGYQSLNTGN